MSVTLKDFQRNVKHRKLAVDNSYTAGGGLGESDPFAPLSGELSEFVPNFAALNNALATANALQKIDGYHPIQCGKIKSFIKRAIRKLIKIFFGWYLFPIYEQQSTVNASLVVSVKQLRDTVETLGTCLADMNGRIEELDKKLEKSFNIPTDDDSFYHHFEERFRGPRELITERLSGYIPTVKKYLPEFDKCTFIDIGSGRGEWMDVIRENGAVNYVGVDLNAVQNAIAEEHGHKTVCEDCVKYIEELPANSVDMISGIQIIEHLYQSDLLKLFGACGKALKPGGVLLFETPNPNNITVGASTFYLDSTHKRVLHPEMIKFFLDFCGLSTVEIIASNASLDWQEVSSDAAEKCGEEVQQKINSIARHLYGPMDYAIVAVKA